MYARLVLKQINIIASNYTGYVKLMSSISLMKLPNRCVLPLHLYHIYVCSCIWRLESLVTLPD